MPSLYHHSIGAPAFAAKKPVCMSCFTLASYQIVLVQQKDKTEKQYQVVLQLERASQSTLLHSLQNDVTKQVAVSQSVRTPRRKRTWHATNAASICACPPFAKLQTCKPYTPKTHVLSPTICHKESWRTASTKLACNALQRTPISRLFL